jgi:FSR family fosmidomycin resistance protein-like MFS transporter
MDAHLLKSRATRTIWVLLLIEFLDELVFGAREAAWPLISRDLGLTYAQIGVLLGVPLLFSNVVEPILGILADVWRRRALILGGGLCFVGALLLTGFSQGFTTLLVAFMVFGPASGAFVSLAQATLMDLAPHRHEQNMARWTFAGSVGVLAGSLAIGALAWLGWGWRGLFLAFAALAALLVAVAWRQPLDKPGAVVASPLAGLRQGLPAALALLRRAKVVRWLLLLEFSDLMLDILLGFLALYFVDVTGATPAQAGLAVTVWTGVGLLGDFLLIPLLERVSGLRYLRLSALLELLLFSAFLLAPGYGVRLALIGLLGFFNAGWYSILQGRLYSTLPEQSGAVLALKNVSGLFGALIPLALGLVAQRAGLGPTMWLLLLGPVALLVGLPSGQRGSEVGDQRSETRD